MRKVLLDANLLIGAFDDEDSPNPAHQKAKETVRAWMVDADVELVITPLVRYEVLRGVRTVSMSDKEAVLNDFPELEVRAEQAREAAEIFRIYQDQRGPNGIALDKRSFDFFHCACAKTYGLEIGSQDSHIAQIQKLIQDHAENA